MGNKNCTFCNRGTLISYNIKDHRIYDYVTGDVGGLVCLECFLTLAKEKKIILINKDFDSLTFINFLNNTISLINEF
jgi:hypothetical protein